MSPPTVRLAVSGLQMPLHGLGTWLSKPGEVATAVRYALEAGYTHIDCAFVYENQKEIGTELTKIFQEGKIKRSNVFITSKIWNTFHSYELAKKNIDDILNELKLDYIDLLLIHWPMGYKEGGHIFPKQGDKMLYSDVDYLEAWKALEDAVDSGRVKSIGLSNFNHEQILRVISNSRIKPEVLQVELHPYFQQRKLRNFCKEQNIHVTAYSPLGNPAMPFRKPGDPTILTEPAVVDIAKKHNKTPAQVALKWAVQHGITVIPKSISESRIRENFNIWDFELSADELATIDALDKNWRILDLTFRDHDHPHFPWNIEF